MKCGPGTAVLGGQILGRGLGSARWEQLHLRSVRWPLSRRAAAGASESLATGRRLLSIGTGFQSRGAGRTAAQASRRHVGAIAAPEDCVYVKEHPLGTHNRARVEVSVAADGSQIIVITTDFPGNRLVLHWGVEGGQGYQGGWRLPGASARPEGTIQYKNRALQTPFHSATGDDGKPMQRVQVVLPTEEASDAINFVFKDEATGSWYDLYDSNYSAPLNPMLMSTVAATVASMDSMDAIDFEASMDFITDIPEIPQELAGIWAYIKWELAGCPNRSQEAADLEYQEGIVELQRLLATGTALDELWRVARGELQYRDFMTRQQLPGGKRGAAPARPSAPPAVAVPEDLVGIQAYIMWEQAGKPDGADFSSAAREELQRKLEAGMTTDDIRQLLQGPPQPKASGAVQQAPPAPKAPPPPAEPQVGQGLGVSWQDPLTMIKKMEAPKLSAERKVREVKPLDYLVQSAAVDDSVVWRRLFPLGSKAELLVCVRREEGPNGRVVLQFTTDLPSELVLHWGVTLPKQGHSWAAPPAALLPPRAERMEGGLAAELAFTDCKDAECDIEILEAKVPLQRITLELPLNHGISAVTFVLRSRDGTRWWRDGDGNFIAPVPGVAQEVPEDPTAGFDELSRDIVACEVQSSEWTLMHRFNKASDILGQQQAGYLKADPEHAAATVYVWLRYSATRQLTWQRNYNTQPRILSSAQDRLTGMIAALHGSTAGEAQEWVRLMLTTVGRGGDGQKIRDEILHIMHRNHIPEKKGLFLEEWHQKLHNNTTPDDVPICEAYLAFLQSNGDTGSYWRVLSDNGVTRERMVSFERPITLEPQFYPDKRDALIRDFRNYLGILKAVHSGADMESAASAAGSSVPKSAKGYLGYVLAHLGDSQILPLMEAAVAARTEIAPHLSGNKDLLYLDLALEDRVRQAAERGAGAVGMAAAAFMTPLLQNVCLSVGNNEELCYCLKAWLSLPDVVRYGGQCSREEALQAAAVVDRIRRAISTLSDRVTQRIEPIATSLGRAFGVEDWVVELFAEEVVRGGPAFAVSLVLSVVEPALRNTAELGSWQVISPYNITGRVCIVSGLQEIQDDVFDEPTVLLAKRVSGEEEIPEGAVAVLTPDAPDVLSHVSVRARNMEVLFATCHDAEAMEQLMAEDGEVLEFSVTAAGAVTWAPGSLGKAASAGGDAHVARRSGSLRIEVPRWCGRWVVPMDEYRDGVVGAKSKNIGHLRGLLPDWIHLPASVTLPFGCFEEALKDNCNREVAKALQAAVKKVPNSPAPALQECRQLVLGMTLPDRLKAALQAGMQEAGIPLPESEERWHMAEASIKGVWASKFNDRAFYSMRKVGLNFMDLRMAVLVQQVVNAEYAFVIHTKNPSTNDDQEIYCEMVRGLGESLVSGMVPGSSLAFVARKDALDRPTLLSYPSKSEGMFCPESLIFRSDSNGEDLQGYAGAGLYDSITMDPTLVSRLDWADDPIVHDDGFRSQLMAKVCSVGHAIEQALGCPQDVEGVVSPNGSITVVQTRPQV